VLVDPKENAPCNPPDPLGLKLVAVVGDELGEVGLVHPWSLDADRNPARQSGDLRIR